MKRTSMVLLMVAACGGEATQPAAAPTAKAAPQEDPQEASFRAQEKAKQDALLAQRGAEEKQQAAFLEGTPARVKAEADAKAAARAAEDRARCDNTRPQRAAQAQEKARAYVGWVTRVAPHLKAIRTNCTVTLKNTGAKRIDRSGSGWRVYDEKQETLSCAGGVPKGLSSDDVYAVLSNQEGDTAQSISVAGCETDAAAGLNVNVLESDVEGIKRLLAWKP